MNVISQDTDEVPVCCFCAKPASQHYGKFFRDHSSNIDLHQYCMFFASGLPQRGADNEGFDGFLPQDILREHKRTRKLRCSHCKRSGASVGCADSSCRVNCHFPCGVKFGMLHQFYGDFRAYCPKHKPVQDVSGTFSSGKSHVCAICLESMMYQPEGIKLLKMPCCNDNIMHQDCLQQQALSSGYFFRCPTCNNQDIFVMEMKKFGIYVPDRDAAWEDGMAYSDLLWCYNRCDAKHCACPGGRLHSLKAGRWKIMRCESCGQSAVHRECARLADKPIRVHVCEVCLQAHNKIHHNAIASSTKPCSVHLNDVVSSTEATVSTYTARKVGQFKECEKAEAAKEKEKPKYTNTFELPCYERAADSNKTSCKSLPVYSRYKRQQNRLFLKRSIGLKCALYNYLSYVLTNSTDE